MGKTRSLSPLESRLILHLEWNKQAVVTVEETMQILDISYDYARQVLHRLSRDRWLMMITPGKYELIPAERGEYAFPDTNPLFIGSVLVEPYYFSFATSAFFHGLTTQASQMVYIAAPDGRPGRMMVREKEYRIVLQPQHKFFGFIEVDAYGTKVNMADLEKTIVDCLDRPEYAGDIPEIAGMLRLGKSRINWPKLVEYAARFQSRSALQRLGYLANRLDLPIDAKARERLLAEASGTTKCYLGQPRRWQTGGVYNATWRIVDNIPNQELFSEFEASL
jgi:predicted transcriptional regulator of viral defense system